MGDMADFFLDDVYSEEEARLDYLTGGMTTADAIDRGVLNEDGSFEPHGHPKAKKCRFCNKSGLYWQRVNDRWRLFEDNHIHICPVNPIVER